MPPGTLGLLTSLMRLDLHSNKVRGLVGVAAEGQGLPTTRNVSVPAAPVGVGLLTCWKGQQPTGAPAWPTVLPVRLSLQIPTLPPDISNLQRLNRFSLHSNDMVLLPPEIGSCTALSWLSLNANKLQVTSFAHELRGMFLREKMLLFIFGCWRVQPNHYQRSRQPVRNQQVEAGGF